MGKIWPSKGRGPPGQRCMAWAHQRRTLHPLGPSDRTGQRLSTVCQCCMMSIDARLALLSLSDEAILQIAVGLFPRLESDDLWKSV
jgi:hypothetical protein